MIKAAVPVLIGVALAVLVQLAAGPIIGPFAAKLLMDIGINVILAVSLNLVNGFTGQFSIGHAGFMAVGGYTAGCITYYGSFLLFGNTQVQPGWLSHGDLLFLGGCLAGAVVAAIAGIIVGLPSLRLRGDYLAIVTLGFGEILRVMLQRTGDVLGTADEVHKASVGTLATSLGGSLGFSGIPYYTDLFWIYTFVTITLVVALRLKFSSYGRAFLSVRENEIAAEAVGINTTRLKVRAFVLAAAFAGIAGGLFAHEVGTSLNPRELGFQKSFDIVIMVVLGGMGSVSGAVLAAIVLTLLPEALRSFSEFRMPIYALALILMMILRPQGILGLRELWELSWFPKRKTKPTEKAAA
ncbi:MAG TPA: branched-chain amino acid ABC transporter permease [Candidatus Polarisedimenticolaceae bacterium]|nr:branched-chain amino acid ABC transporter permease [Candidatus Polarisedimenticolaceae bacterium]